jgi:hypothetical protein
MCFGDFLGLEQADSRLYVIWFPVWTDQDVCIIEEIVRVIISLLF